MLLGISFDYGAGLRCSREAWLDQTACTAVEQYAPAAVAMGRVDQVPLLLCLCTLQ
jgi:hypothetical protein